MMRVHATLKKLGVLLSVLLLTCCAEALAQQADSAEYTLVYWVEKANLTGNIGDPAKAPGDLVNFEAYGEETRTALVGERIMLTAETAGEALRTPGGRRFAGFLSADQALVQADGSTVINAYYTRDTFTFVFNLGYAEAEMTIDGVTYTGSGAEKYTMQGEYQQTAVVPGMENGLLPVSTNPNLQTAECVGWMQGVSAGSLTTRLLTHATQITEEMLPTEDIPAGEEAVVELTGIWYNEADKAFVACWYEELPEEKGQDLNRMTYNGKTYVNYPATNYELTVPRGATPDGSSANGLTYCGQMAPPESASGSDRVWQFIYDRGRYVVSFDANGAETVAGGTVMYRQNLGAFDPGWGQDTTRTEDGVTYRFTGWFLQGVYVSHSLSSIWMPAFDLHLTAGWEAETGRP